MHSIKATECNLTNTCSTFIRLHIGLRENIVCPPATHISNSNRGESFANKIYVCIYIMCVSTRSQSNQRTSHWDSWLRYITSCVVYTSRHIKILLLANSWMDARAGFNVHRDFNPWCHRSRPLRREIFLLPLLNYQDIFLYIYNMTKIFKLILGKIFQ